MISWITGNLATILVCLVLSVIVGWAIWYLVRQKKRGKSSCGCGCSGCAMRGACHSEK